MEQQTIILLAIPIALINLTLAIISLVNLYKKPRTKHLSKPIWACIVLFVQTIGPIAYLVIEGGTYDSD